MAKLTSFLRRMFTSITSDDEYSTSEPRKSIVIIPPLTPPSIISSNKLPPNTIRSCSASPRLITRSIIKQRTIQVDSRQHGNSHLNFLSSNTSKSTNRRLSAPLIIHASTHHRLHRSAVFDEAIEEALISPLQRLSISSPTANSIHHNNSVNSLGTSAGGSANASPRNDAHSLSLNLSLSNSINLPNSLNNISPASGMCSYNISYFSLLFFL